MPNETFISYSRKDINFVARIEDKLRAAGIDPWIDKEDIPSGVLWRQEILVGIQFCQNFIYIISPDSVRSQYCDMELDHALALNKRIIPIVCQLDPGVRAAVAELNWIFFNNFDRGIQDLLELLDSPLGTTFGDRLDCQVRISDKYGNRIFPLYRNEYRIGRNPEASFAEAGLFRLGDEKVSRTHGTLRRKDGRWIIMDGSATFNQRGYPTNYSPSANGIKIERLSEKGRIISSEQLRKLQMRPLIHGDVIRLSENTALIYEEISPDHEYRRIEQDDRETLTSGEL